MTKEEAIKELKQIPAHIGQDCEGYELRAIRMAIESLDEPYWHTEKPKEDGEYLIKVNGVHLVCFFSTLRKKKEFSYWSYYNDREQYYSLDEVQGWHKIPPYEETV